MRYAIRNNYCRCTGYVKIIKAIELAAQLKKAGVIPEPSEADWKLGSSVHRLDVEEKVLAYGIAAAAFLISALFDLNVLFIIIGAAVVGIVSSLILERRAKK